MGRGAHRPTHLPHLTCLCPCRCAPGPYCADPSKTSLDAGTNTYSWQNSPGWTSGFFPGILWQLYAATATASTATRAKFGVAAANWTIGRKGEATDNSTHDVGFMLFGSFGNGVELGPSDGGHRGACTVQRGPRFPPCPPCPPPVSSPLSASTCPSLIPMVSRAVCSHHCLDRRIPGVRSVAKSKSMIGRISMFCATLF